MSVGRTLAAEARVSGVGLFTARPATVAILPASPGEGWSLSCGAGRVAVTVASLASKPLVPIFERVPPRHTCIDAGNTRLATIEHLVSALAGLGVTDARIACDGPEVPILDGSSEPFVRAILDAGIVERGEVDERVIAEPIRVADADGGGVIDVHPREKPGCSFTYRLSYPPGAPIPAQSASWDGKPETYAKEVSPARTYCLEQEAVQMRALGLFRHLTPRDMLVIGSNGPIENVLRFPDEPARHKLLDLIGDLALATGGTPIRADIVASRSGHALAQEAARRIAAMA